MTIALLVINDGRDSYALRSLASALRYLPKFNQYIFVDDRDHSLGFAGAIRSGWAQVETTYVFHLEADFTFDQRVPVPEMVDLLWRQPHLLQVALMRQPWSPEEIEAGGIIQRNPESYHERHDDDAIWTEHRVNFTTNPSVYPSRITRLGWPDPGDSERVFSDILLADPLAAFAFWGSKFSRPLCQHIGLERAGVGY